MRVKYVLKKDKDFCRLSTFPNFHKSGSIAGMKKLYYGEDALLVQCGEWIYTVTSAPWIYYSIAH